MNQFEFIDIDDIIDMSISDVVDYIKELEEYTRKLYQDRDELKNNPQ